MIRLYLCASLLCGWLYRVRKYLRSGSGLCKFYSNVTVVGQSLNHAVTMKCIEINSRLPCCTTACVFNAFRATIIAAALFLHNWGKLFSDSEGSEFDRTLTQHSRASVLIFSNPSLSSNFENRLETSHGLSEFHFQLFSIPRSGRKRFVSEGDSGKIKPSSMMFRDF